MVKQRHIEPSLTFPFVCLFFFSVAADVTNSQDLLDALTTATGAGKEGVIVKDETSPYILNDRSDWVSGLSCADSIRWCGAPARLLAYRRSVLGNESLIVILSMFPPVVHCFCGPISGSK